MPQTQGPVTCNTNSFNTTGSLNHNTNSLNHNNHCFNTNITVADDRAEILTWLSPLEPRLRHSDLESRRVRNVGDWLLQTEEFRSWKNSDGQCGSQKATMFCSGNPGVGKTYIRYETQYGGEGAQSRIFFLTSRHISSLVADTLCDEAGKAGEHISVACFYFDFAAQNEQSAGNMLGALLKQVVSGFKQIPEEITNAFEKHQEVIGGRRIQLPEIVKLLGSLSSMRPTFFCLDALDECAALHRAKTLLSLQEIIKMSPTTRVFLTGRPHVGSEVEKHLPCGVAVVSISPRKDDIIRYIHAKLEEDTTSEEMDEKLEAEIIKNIPETVSEM